MRRENMSAVEFTSNAGDATRLDLTGDYARDVRAAVEFEHGGCSDDACDIREALEAGFPVVAAFLLYGATEAPAVDAVVDAYPLDARPVDPRRGVELTAWPEWDAWVAHFHEHGRECEACGAFTFASDYFEPEACANCLAALPTREEDR